MATQLFYPSADSAPSIETIFIDGHRFDICEVQECHFDLLLPAGNFKKPGGRFFVAVENDFIVNYRHTEKLHAAGIENRWDFFCLAKSDCKDIIKQFEEAVKSLNSMRASLDKHPKMAYTLQPRIDAKINSIFERYGLNL